MSALTPLTPAVEGYPQQLSYLPGEEVAFHCTARASAGSGVENPLPTINAFLWDARVAHEPRVAFYTEAASTRWMVA